MSPAPVSYDRAAEQVKDLTVSGTPFPHVEAAIDTAQVRQDEKAALWLLAWSLRGPALPMGNPADAGGVGISTPSAGWHPQGVPPA